jgi:hypothetical protein
MAIHPLKDEVLVEITRRAAKSGLHASDMDGQNTWAQYALVLDLARRLLAQAPESVQACEEFEIEEKTSEAVTRIVEVLHLILPGGIQEMVSYLPLYAQTGVWRARIKEQFS